jgi:transposase
LSPSRWCWRETRLHTTDGMRRPNQAHGWASRCGLTPYGVPRVNAFERTRKGRPAVRKQTITAAIPIGNGSEVFVGLDVGDKITNFCARDAEGTIVHEGRIHSTREGLEHLASLYPRGRCLMEVGTHSPWMERHLEGLGIITTVCEARRANEHNRNKRKTDRLDAQRLANMLRTRSTDIVPVLHRSLEDQKCWSILVARDGAVRARTKLINLVRGLCKSVGGRLPKKSAEAFGSLKEFVPQELSATLAPIFALVETLSDTIRGYDKQIEVATKKAHPEAKLLRTIPGVGPISAFGFVLAVGNINRFKHTRNVAAYFGLVPQVRSSGKSDPELRISKRGNGVVRRLLTCAGHYVLGPLNKTESDLRTWGLKIAGDGSKKKKKRAVIAVARKIAVVMAAMMKSGEPYDPFRTAKRGALVEAATRP